MVIGLCFMLCAFMNLHFLHLFMEIPLLWPDCAPLLVSVPIKLECCEPLHYYIPMLCTKNVVVVPWQPFLSLLPLSFVTLHGFFPFTSIAETTVPFLRILNLIALSIFQQCPVRNWVFGGLINMCQSELMVSVESSPNSYHEL